jgi:hypothetical protein
LVDDDPASLSSGSGPVLYSQGSSPVLYSQGSDPLPDIETQEGADAPGYVLYLPTPEVASFGPEVENPYANTQAFRWLQS